MNTDVGDHVIVMGSILEMLLVWKALFAWCKVFAIPYYSNAAHTAPCVYLMSVDGHTIVLALVTSQCKFGNSR